jgi:uncharacterized protein YutE (UPF0331/DUF86 family)
VSRCLPAAADNKGVFSVLAEAGVISPELAAQLVAMACFRNIIVHDYVRIDDGIVLGALRRRVGDLADFSQAILRALDKA